jgi:hypothetical protein
MAKSNNKPKPLKATKTAKATSVKKATVKKVAAELPSHAPKSKTDEILDFLSQMHRCGILNAPKALVARRAGCLGPRGDGFTEAVKELMESDLIAFGDNKDQFCLTEKGKDALLKDYTPPCDNAEAQALLLDALTFHTKEEKAANLWGILLDGEHHTVDKLAGDSGFKDKRNPDFLDVIQMMVELGLATKAGSVVQLLDIAFPFGRPH